MGSIHRIGLAIAGIVTVFALAGAFVFQGYMAAKQAQAATTPPDAALASPSDSPTPLATDTPPQIVYIEPAATPPATPAPGVVRQPKAATLPAQPAANPTIHVIVTRPPESQRPGDD